MKLPGKYLWTIPLALLCFGLRFVLEAVFPNLQNKFGRNNTEAGVLAFFFIAILLAWFTRRARNKENQ